MLYNVDVYANGTIGISEDNLPEEFYKLYHIDYDDYCIRENGTCLHVVEITSAINYIWFNKEQFQLMQYTGFDDKNSKPIYEDDIIEGIDYSNINKGSVYWFGNGGWLVTWNTKLLGQFPMEFIQIIGNIYQNPDLLK